MCRISIDFDGTLSRDDVQSFVKELINIGVEIWIVTSRLSFDPEKEIDRFVINGTRKFYNSDLYKVADELGIPNERIVFTNALFKTYFLRTMDFDAHLDDCDQELDMIRHYLFENGDGALGVNVNYSTYQQILKAVVNEQNN